MGEDLGRRLNAARRRLCYAVFVCNYPRSEAFYMKENPADPRTVLCNDCLAQGVL